MARMATETTELARKEKCFYGILQPHGRQYTEATEELTGSRTTTEPNQNQRNLAPPWQAVHRNNGRADRLTDDNGTQSKSTESCAPMVGSTQKQRKS